MNEYKQASRHAAFGAVAVALTAMTIGLAVVLPAKIDTGAREVRTVAVPAQPVMAPAATLDSDPIVVVVVAKRDSAWMPAAAHAQLAAPKTKSQASGRLGVRAVATRERLGRTDAGLQRALCPYLTNGMVAATS
jgi:predicted component of type VI protein secretion system